MYSSKELNETYNAVMAGYQIFLTEASVKELKERWVMTDGREGRDENRIPESMFDDIEKADPSENKKYLPWMLKRFAEERGPHTMDRLKTAIATFHELTARNQLKGQESDIFSYKNIEKLDDVVKHFVDPDTGEILKTKSEVKKEKSGLEGPEDVEKDELMFDNEYAFVVKPFRKNTSIKYGRGTTWCTSADGTRNLYNQYYLIDHFTLWYIIAKDPVLKNLKDQRAFKIAAAVPPKGSSRSTEYFYANDNPMDKRTFQKYMKEWHVPMD